MKIQITNVEVIAKTRAPSPNPKRDAIQALPGTGSVQVVVTTEGGIVGTGAVGYGRIDGGPAALAAVIEHTLKPLLLHQELTMIWGLHQAMLRETEYHGAFGLTMFALRVPWQRAGAAQHHGLSAQCALLGDW